MAIIEMFGWRPLSHLVWVELAWPVDNHCRFQSRSEGDYNWDRKRAKKS